MGRSVGSKAYAKLLRDPRWQAFREEIVALDNSTCMNCGRQREKGLHVHHKSYISGLKPWEYPPEMLETLCAGCHAAEHGIIVPKVGWDLVFMTDSGDLSESCEYCETEIRYVFTIWHKNWGMLNVGTVCCDRLTETTIASDEMKRVERRARFIGSSRWKQREKSVRIKQSGFAIFVVHLDGFYRIRMIDEYGTSVLGNGKYRTEEEARGRVFDVINDGSAAQAFAKMRVS